MFDLVGQWVNMFKNPGQLEVVRNNIILNGLNYSINKPLYKVNFEDYWIYLGTNTMEYRVTFHQNYSEQQIIFFNNELINCLTRDNAIIGES